MEIFIGIVLVSIVGIGFIWKFKAEWIEFVKAMIVVKSKSKKDK